MRSRPAQTLLELVIASGIIVTSVTATATLIVSTVSTGRVSQSNIEAANFAREGVEIIRSIRDSNWLKADRNILAADNNPVEWDDLPGSAQSLGGATPGSPKYYAVSSLTSSGWQLRDIGATAIPQKIYDQAGVNYAVQPATACAGCRTTRFSRLIQIIKDTECVLNCSGNNPARVDVDRLKVTSYVLWNERTGKPVAGFTGYNHMLAAEGYLYKWR